MKNRFPAFFLPMTAALLFALSGRVCAASDWEYLLVSSQTLLPSFQPIVSLRSSQGLNVHTMVLENTLPAYPGRDEAEKLRNLIKDGWKNHGTRYVLLGGSGNHVPVRRVNVEFLDGNYHVSAEVPCDLYFSALEGDWDGNANGLFGEMGDSADMTPQVAVGRIPSDSPSEVTKYVSRLVSWEQGATGPFSSLLAGEPLWEGYGDTWLDTIRPFFAGGQMSTLDSRRQSWDEHDLALTMKNANPLFLIHAGHGDEGYTMGLTPGNMSGLSDCAPFLLYDMAELAGDWTTTGNVGKALVTGPDSVALAALMNSTDSSLLLPGMKSPASTWCRAFWQSMFWEGNSRIGDALNHARLELACRLDDPYLRWSGLGLNLLGCPAIRMRWNCSNPGLELSPVGWGEGLTAAQGVPINLRVSLHTRCSEPVRGGTVNVSFTVASTSIQIPFRDNGQDGDEIAGDGIYTAVWTPQQKGPVSIQIAGNASGQSAVPVSFGGMVTEGMHYCIRSTPFRWTKLTSSARNVEMPGQDDAVSQVDLPFSFPFYGRLVNSVWVTTNGNLFFQDVTSSDRRNSCLAEDEAPDSLLACYWADLVMGEDSTIRTDCIGQSPNRSFIVQWNRMRRDGKEVPVTFQAILEEKTGIVHVQYLKTELETDLSSATDTVAGIRGTGGDSASVYSCRKPVLSSRSSLEYLPATPSFPLVQECRWGAADRQSVVLPGDTSAPVWIRIYNEGNVAAGSLRVSLTCDSGVSVVTPDQILPQLDPRTEKSFLFRVNIPGALAIGQKISFQINLFWTDSSQQPFTRSENFRLVLGRREAAEIFQDTVENGTGGWTFECRQGNENWFIAAGEGRNGTSAWKVRGEDKKQEAILMSPWLLVPESGKLEFYQRMDSEDGYDGGRMEILPEGASDWMDVSENLLSCPYTCRISEGYGNPLAGSEAWSGWTQDSADWKSVILDLAGLEGQKCLFRFRFGADESVASSSWLMDDFHLSGYIYKPANSVGDVNGDGYLTSDDLVIFQTFLAGKLSPDDPSFLYPGRADLNKDGALNADDIVAMANILSGNVQ